MLGTFSILPQLSKKRSVYKTNDFVLYKSLVVRYEVIEAT